MAQLYKLLFVELRYRLLTVPITMVNQTNYKKLLLSMFICAALLSSCSRYAITLNERPVYTPPKLLQNIRAMDPALRDCLKQTITDGNITKAEQLIRMSCSYGNITSLSGISQFSELQQLDISFNPIDDFSPLIELQGLKQLKIEGIEHNNCPQIRQLVGQGVVVTGGGGCE